MKKRETSNMPDNLYAPPLAGTICQRIAEDEKLPLICRTPECRAKAQ